MNQTGLCPFFCAKANVSVIFIGWNHLRVTYELPSGLKITLLDMGVTQ